MRSDRYKEEDNRKKKKKKRRGPLRALLVLILILLIAIVSLVIYFYKAAEDSLSLTFTDEALSVEFGGYYPAMDYVRDHEGEVTADAAMLDAGATGDHQLVYTVSKEVLGGLLEPSKEFTLSYTVVDSEPPVMLWSGDGSVLERGSEFDINDVIAYGDSADPEPAVKVDGEADMQTSGTYPLHVTVTDASGNSTDWDLTVEVSDVLPSYEDNAERTDFADFVAAYKEDGRSFGIDVSEWQDDVDFGAVKDAGCEFVMIRIGYESDDGTHVDSMFNQNFERARAAGLKVGVYFYSYDNTADAARASADWVIEKLAGAELDLPVAFDWEDFGSFQTYGMSFAGLNGLYDTFADEINAAGYECMLYGSKIYLENVWDNTDTRTVWLAHYTEKTDYKSPYMIWQASCTGNIAGIDGDVDMDILYEQD